MMRYIQANIKIDPKSYPKEAQMLLELRSDRELNREFRKFLSEKVKKERQMPLL